MQKISGTWQSIAVSFFLQSKEEVSGMSSAKEVAFAGKPSVTNRNTKEESSYKKEHHDRTQYRRRRRRRRRRQELALRCVQKTRTGEDDEISSSSSDLHSMCVQNGRKKERMRSATSSSSFSRRIVGFSSEFCVKAAAESAG